MANSQLFQSKPNLPPTNVVNQAGGRAYAFGPKHALAQLAATGTFNTTFYSSPEDQLKEVIEQAKQCDSAYLAKLAIYSRERGYMKDMPALLCAILASRHDSTRLNAAWKVIDNGRMLRNFVQMIRSGVTGRKSLGYRPRKLVERWIQAQNTRGLLQASIGNDPSLRDVMRMVRPKPTSPERAALFAWIVGKKEMQAWGKKDVKAAITMYLPKEVYDFERWKDGVLNELPAVPFEMLVGEAKSKKDWTAIAMLASWTQLRMNLNTFQRHGVFEDRQVVLTLAERLRDAERIRRAKVFPYQLMAAYMHADPLLPHELREALQDAMEVAVENVPAVEGKIFILVDVSGSMRDAITGARKGATSKVRCVDVAGLVASAFLRMNKSTEIIPFDGAPHMIPINPRDTVMTNAAKLAAIGGGGTNCSAPLALLNHRKSRGDVCMFISDNQSWMDSDFVQRSVFNTGNQPSQAVVEWKQFKGRNPQAKLVCLDIQPYTNAQVPEQKDVLNLGGFSDATFESIASFVRGEMGTDHWVGEIEKIKL